MQALSQLEKFNFWTGEIDYKTCFSVQSILDGSTENCHSVGCSSDQDGSQEDGGMDCSTCPEGE